ncbi:MAG: hydrogenase expression/formation protein HypE [Acidimicrobiales bacterium]
MTGRAAEGWACPLPLRQHDRIVLGHGGGGQLSAELVEHLFLPALGRPGAELHDAAALPVPAGAGRLAVTTDSYVVQPLFFPGGCIGDLAVNGTVNDLAMAGAQPVAITLGCILEEGLELAVLGRVMEAVGAAARAAGVSVVAGDTKVVEAGHGDGIYLNTAGVGVIPEGVDIRPGRAAPGDVVIVSGPIGLHGVAVLSQREGIEFGTGVRSDTAPLNGLVAAMLAAAGDHGDGVAGVHVLRDPTRGGLGASLCEIAASAGVGIEYDELRVPVPDEVAAACSFLGLDPMHIANEGRLVAIVAEPVADAVLAAMRAQEAGGGAVPIGRVVAEHPGLLVARTPYGATRVVDLPLGEQLPRIC